MQPENWDGPSLWRTDWRAIRFGETWLIAIACSRQNLFAFWFLFFVSRKVFSQSSNRCTDYFQVLRTSENGDVVFQSHGSHQATLVVM